MDTVLFSPLLRAHELLQHLTEYVIIDASSSATAKQDYDAEHIQGALFVDMNTDLATIGTHAMQGGRHPLPSLEKFAKTVSKLGIQPQSQVLIYDRQNGANAAARLWWMLKAIGHQRVQVLDGGLEAAKAAGIAIDNQAVEVKAVSSYPVPDFWTLPLATLQDVQTASQTGEEIIVDVRSSSRYQGLVEPIDQIAGHIPMAVNIPFADHLDGNGYFLSVPLLKNKYGSLPLDKTIIHCGSGVTACHTILAIAAAGLPLPKLYVGSWSEWSNNALPMVMAK